MSSSENIPKVLEYPILSRYTEILHFTSTRSGGVSTGKYASLNLGKYSGDKNENIQENLSRFCSKIGIETQQVYLPFQTHGNSVLIADEEFLTQSAEKQANLLHHTDALITNIPDVCIAVSTADCVPILLYDPENRVIASIHAGWKGTCSRIAANTIQIMQATFGVNPKNLIAVIGPSISPAMYEVGAELIDTFMDAGFDVDKIFIRINNKIYLNLWKANNDILLENGVDESNIEISGYCTYTGQSIFFSARRLGIKSGRMISGIMLKKN